MPQRLTKSRFKLGCECPTKLAYAAEPKRYPSNKESPFLEALAEGGYQVGELAKLGYPGGVEVETLDEARALAETAALLDAPNATVFEAPVGIPTENLLVRVDVLQKKGRNLRIVEVKAKSFDPEKDAFWGRRGGLVSSWLPYLLDVAFQTWVVRRAYPDANVTASLLLANKRAVASVDGIHTRFLARKSPDPESGRLRLRCELRPGTTAESLGIPLLVERCVDDEVRYVLDEWRDPAGRSFNELVALLAPACAEGRRIPPRIGAQCAGCEFRPDPDLLGPGQASGLALCWNECTGIPVERLLREPLVLDLWNDRKKGDRIAAGEHLLADVDEHALAARSEGDGEPGLDASARQVLQVARAKAGDAAPHVDLAAIRGEMAELRYPLHFVDFETTMVAIPFTTGRRPYEQHAFQFSHHVMYADGRVEHRAQYLDSELGSFPNYRFLRELRASLGEDGGTFVHYAGHENTVLAQIRRQLVADPRPPADAAELVAFVESLASPGKDESAPWQPTRARVDLLRWVKRYYYDPRMGGSNSIKVVLPAVLAGSVKLERAFGRPTYGTPEGIPSLNFRAMQWFERDAAGEVINPYDKLPPLFGDAAELGPDEDRLLRHDAIKEGGAAMTAYARMQFEEMSEAERGAIRDALLAYCELDTLAMVMVFEGLRGFIDARV